MITVQLWCDEELETFEMESNQVLGYVELVKNFGYVDEDCSEYKFKSAQMGIDKFLSIYLESV